jgi:hypothetical protein
MAKTGKAAKSRFNKNHDLTQKRQARTLDSLAEFEAFDKSILPQLKKMVLENWSAEKIRKHFAPLVQVKIVEKAMKGDFKAMKDIMDRHEGLAVQRIEQKTTIQNMDAKERAALILQKLKDAKVIGADGSVLLEESDEEDY